MHFLTQNMTVNILRYWLNISSRSSCQKISVAFYEFKSLCIAWIDNLCSDYSQELCSDYSQELCFFEIKNVAYDY
jgi:hypothetical protein